MAEKKKDYFDIKYVIQLQKGDQSAFDFIYTYYKNHIYWMGINYFSNEEKAQDLVQAVFLEIYQNIRKLKEPGKFYSWMNRIAYSRCLQMIRYDMKDSLHYTNNMGEDYADNFIEDNKSDDLVTHVQKEMIKDIIVNEIEKLSPKYRTICYLRFFEDLSYAEISEITEVPIGTLTNYIGRLKPKLQNALKKGGFTSASYLGLIMLPNMVGYFKSFIELKNPLNKSKADEILNEVKQTKITTSKKANKSWQVAAYGCISLAIALPIGATTFARDNTSSNVGENARIQNIQYPKKLTNTPFKIQVETSNENYDEILLNNKADLTIRWNGDYTVTMMRNGKEIDSESISISNIDRDIPIVTKESFEKGFMVLTLEDKDSGIDFANIEFYEDGLLSKNYKLDIEKKTVYISKETSTNNVLKVPDFAGNVQEVKILFYEVDVID